MLGLCSSYSISLKMGPCLFRPLVQNLLKPCQRWISVDLKADDAHAAAELQAPIRLNLPWLRPHD